jgi:hypothetical protein
MPLMAYDLSVIYGSVYMHYIYIYMYIYIHGVVKELSE